MSHALSRISAIFDEHSSIFATILALALIGLTLFAWSKRRRLRSYFENLVESHELAIDCLTPTVLPKAVFIASALLLFAELMIIRIHASYFQVFAYYKNVTLLSCFLGLGVGFARGSGRKLYTPLVLPGLGLQIALLYLLRFTLVQNALQNPVQEYSAFGFGPTWSWVNVVAGLVFCYLFLGAVFVANALCFLPLGHLTSRLMQRCEAVSSYGWNLLGSLLGIAAFTALSFLCTSPAIWFGFFGLAMVWFFLRGHEQLLPASLAVIGCLTILSFSFRTAEYDLYSPYQILSVSMNRSGRPEVKVNNVYFQKILDLRPDQGKSDEERTLGENYYNAPYALKKNARDVLIVGSGTGNDVAAAVRHNASHVDAVEIDPVILQLGRLLHPESPYQNPAVTAHNTDARAYFRSAKKGSYDLVVFGYLDSHTLLASASSVRLDSFVYTVDSFRTARALLKDQGILCLSFAEVHSGIGGKLFRMLAAAFDGKEPFVYQAGYNGGTLLCSSDSPTALGTGENGLPNVTAQVRALAGDREPSTDDWPFLYMMKRQYPTSYLVMMLVFLVLSSGFCRRFSPGFAHGISLPCFFLGAGFMLVETKAITELALLYGSTWIVVSVVIAAILGMAYLSNLLVKRDRTLPDYLIYPLIAATLLLGYFIPTAELFSGMGSASDVAVTAFLTAPIFLAGLVFSRQLRIDGVDKALSSNLIGAMLGGFLEYNALYFGYQMLYALAAILYCLAFVTSLKRSAF